MKYSNYVGVLCALALILFCWLPWVYIESINTIVTGLSTGATNFGRPGGLHIFFAVLAIVFFLIQKVWAKRVNVFVVTLNFAWAIRNFILITQCEAGECPQKKLGIFAVFFFSTLILIMGMLPKVNLKNE